ncbi:gustatory receptor for sugar taste 64a-like [Papilio machaon]|uniref:gustatory receptor for sugar taste 64a-like n=1 Tax=Papilio machaon TaxID=76193 RepID=UPI001E663521|nr:gustatory receptor for sugar taste 64a-like [Papilio machaon]
MVIANEQTQNTIFTYTKWTGIPVYGGKIATIWALILFILLCCLEAAAIWKLIRILSGVAVYSSASRSLVARLSGTIFYANSLISLVLTWRFIAAWDDLSQHWLKNELLSGLNTAKDKYIKRKIIFVTTFVSVCAIVEHIFSMMAAIGFHCGSLEGCLRTYILISHGFVLQSYEYNLWFAIPIFILSKLATILWNLQDLAIILMSMGIVSRYSMLNLYTKKLIQCEYQKKLNYNKLSYQHIDQWRKLRRSYARQAKLVRLLEKHLGPLVLLSNLNNLYFICLQLYLGIRIMSRSWISRTYYLLSLTWLSSRACGVVLAAAAIILYSKKALPDLRSCSSATYNIEVKRLITQLTYDNVGLSGMKLFFLSRQSLLEVVATVIKYELILLQYDK